MKYHEQALSRRAADRPSSVEPGIVRVPKVVEPRRALDLFSGTGAVSKRLHQWGYEVISLDNRITCNVTYCEDILKWKYK